MSRFSTTFRQSLTGRLTTVCTVLAAALMAALLLAQYQSARVTLRASLEERHGRLTERTAALLEERLRALSMQVDDVAASLDDKALRDKTRLQQRLAQLTLIAPHGFTTLGVSDLNGSTLAWVPTHTAPPAHSSVADRDYFSEVVATNTRVIAGPVLSRVTRTHVTVFASPIHSADGKVVGVVVGAVENTALGSTAGLGGVAGGPVTRVTVASTDGIIVAHRNADRTGESVRTLGPMAKLFLVADGRSATFHGLNAEGVPSVMYATSISGPSTPWRLVMEAPVSAIFGAAERELRRNLLVVLSVAAALLPMLWLCIRSVLRPVRTLHQQVKSLSEGSYFPHADAVDHLTSDELELGEALRRLARANSKGLVSEEAETARLRTALHNVEAGVIVVDCETRITAINHAAARMLGWRMSDALNRPLDLVYQPRLRASGELVPSLHPALLSAKTALRREDTLEALSRCGKVAPVSEAAAPVFLADGTTAGAVIVLKEVPAVEAPVALGPLLRDETTGLRQALELQPTLSRLFSPNRQAHGHHAVVTVDLAGCGDDGPTLGQLRNAGKVVRETIRMGDQGFRWMEARLLLILKNCDLPEAAFIGEDLLAKLRASDAPTAAQVSIGVLAFGGDVGAWSQVVEAARGLADAARNEPGMVYIAPESNGAGMLDALGELFGHPPAA